MKDRPLYRWEVRRLATARRFELDSQLSMADFILLTVIMAMLVIVIRIIFIFGGVQGMWIGPFHPTYQTLFWTDPHYANIHSVTESFHALKFISFWLFLYWVLTAWRSFASPHVSFGTKLFKGLIGMMIALLGIGSLLPEYAPYLV